MDSRERMFLALEHEAGDRIPIDFWASSSMIRKLERGLGISDEQFLIDPSYADTVEHVDFVTRVDGRTIRFEAEDFLNAFERFNGLGRACIMDERSLATPSFEGFAGANVLASQMDQTLSSLSKSHPNGVVSFLNCRINEGYLRVLSL